ncbi:MAG: hypothetical protein NUV57_06500 [archaeon]|nr:hypothetical protein [archaeon]
MLSHGHPCDKVSEHELIDVLNIVEYDGGIKSVNFKNERQVFRKITHGLHKGSILHVIFDGNKFVVKGVYKKLVNKTWIDVTSDYL